METKKISFSPFCSPDYSVNELIAELDEQLKQASKSAQLIVAQTMLTNKPKADRYVVVVGSIGCAINDLRKAQRTEQE